MRNSGIAVGWAFCLGFSSLCPGVEPKSLAELQIENKVPVLRGIDHRCSRITQRTLELWELPHLHPRKEEKKERNEEKKRN